MPIQFDADMTWHLDNILHQASKIVHDGARAYSLGQLTPHIVGDMQKMQADMAELLAYFEDGAGYGSVDDETRIIMRNFEETASAWLEAVDMMVAELTKPEKVAA